ncbi:YozE family protein [Heyndrickxia sporothermodurans]|uniref:UPF0346 protein JGZ69_17675 n=1 Tax=Heyndrickxia sporothermodurans TaxID=46224 RepID=A0AB37HB00_9BACI|nr:YozE family protein [Heyndrickxia sporothermodurans]MBL5769103.1 YozE family protein [Heyndrickxia sporothermodurans]MBL5772879.1 YozE family protein [Heyndrickxia sporothermodurans]MBL5776338.1 YozE family protein [Heyndrickxia sporothermodurans]MBL5779876.1 YozE family protein [Heyndrickxia sporothermodurans]MBL5783458.1 YozE family protein [Heyndrickxia sporothermodurans]
MNKSFYHYLMKFRDPKPKDSISEFANHAYKDHSFPKGLSTYNELSTYLELNGDYLTSMTVFDQVWELYIEEKNYNS